MREYSIARLLASATAGGRGRFRAPALLQSWPGIVHGGGLVALLDGAAAGGAAGPRTVEARLTASVPVDTPLALEARGDAAGAAAAVLQEDGQPLASATVAPGAATPTAPPTWRGGDDGCALPMSDHCLACGALNPAGLRQALACDAAGVWARLATPARWREPDGRAHPALAPVLLDEVAWWLGALTMQEGGLTNRIGVTYLRGDLGAGPHTAAGRLADVVAVDRRRTFWRTRVGLWDGGGALVAAASIVFRGGPDYSARQMPFFRARTDAAGFRRLFPAHAG